MSLVSEIPVVEKSHGSAAAAWLGIVVMIFTLSLAALAYYVQCNLDLATGLVKRHGPMDEVSQFAFVGSLASGSFAMLCCLLGLPRKPAITGGVLIIVLLIAYRLYTPMRFYFP